MKCGLDSRLGVLRLAVGLEPVVAGSPHYRCPCAASQPHRPRPTDTGRRRASECERALCCSNVEWGEVSSCEAQRLCESSTRRMERAAVLTRGAKPRMAGVRMRVE